MDEQETVCSMRHSQPLRKKLRKDWAALDITVRLPRCIIERGVEGKIYVYGNVRCIRFL